MAYTLKLDEGLPGASPERRPYLHDVLGVPAGHKAEIVNYLDDHRVEDPERWYIYLHDGEAKRRLPGDYATAEEALAALQRRYDGAD